MDIQSNSTLFKNYKNSRYDLIIAGGGLAGLMSAIAAKREGLKVLLIEKNGCMGGMATSSLVSPFMPYVERGGAKLVNRGLFEELLIELYDIGATNDLYGREENFYAHAYNSDLMKIVLDRMAVKNGVEVLFHSLIVDVVKEGARITGIAVAGKTGIKRLTAEMYIDATGDANLVGFAGLEYNLGRSGDGLCQPMTSCFRLSGSPWKNYDRKTVNELFRRKKAEGKIKNPRENILAGPFMHEPDSDLTQYNATRILNRNPLLEEDLTAAEMEAREQIFELYNFLKESVEGFENCKIINTASEIGIRESRRILGHYVITREDLLNTVKFEDSIARGSYEIDIHNPSNEGTVIERIPCNDYYTIPYRALVPKGLDNVIVAGRPISSTHEAHSAFRIMPITSCMGHAAGIAAAEAIKTNKAFIDVSVAEVQKKLTAANGLV